MDNENKQVELNEESVELNEESLESVNGGEIYRDIVCDYCGFVEKGWPPKYWVARGCLNCGKTYGYYLTPSGNRKYIGWK